ncbi:MAG: HAD family hydrolase [Acidiferrobacterales bacterium]
MSLAIFDLDNTLINGDSDYEWGQFLIENQLVDGEEYESENARYYEQYKAGTLDILAFLAFALKPLAQHDREQLNQWHATYMQQKILPMIGDKARSLVEKHRLAGDTLIIITATNRFVTEPIAREFEIDHLIATDAEMENGRYTGKVAGTPCFRQGKVERLKDWIEINRVNLDGSWFYSDSHNDLPLLNVVDHPVAVNPDAQLEAEAKRLHWPILKLY